MTTPAALKKGDLVSIVAPSGIVKEENVKDGLALLESWGLELQFGKYVYGQVGMYSGTDAERLEDLQSAINNPDTKAIICARGGYGAVRLLDELDFSALKKHPKWLVGFSDITVLHAHWNNCLDLESIHAPMPRGLGKDDETDAALKALLFGENYEYTFDATSLNRAGSAEGTLIGGNLSLLYALQGSKEDFDPTGKLLFIEDLGEYYYHLDRMMHSFKRAGKLEGLAGLIVGGMTDFKDGNDPFGKVAEEIIREAVEGYDYPLAFHFPAGHQEKNLALLLGRKARLNVDEAQCSLSY